MKKQLIALFSRCYDLSQKSKFFVWCEYAPSTNSLTVYYRPKGDDNLTLKFLVISEQLTRKLMKETNQKLDKLEGRKCKS